MLLFVYLIIYLSRTNRIKHCETNIGNSHSGVTTKEKENQERKV